MANSDVSTNLPIWIHLNQVLVDDPVACADLPVRFLLKQLKVADADEIELQKTEPYEKVYNFS